MWPDEGSSKLARPTVAAVTHHIGRRIASFGQRNRRPVGDEGRGCTSGCCQLLFTKRGPVHVGREQGLATKGRHSVFCIYNPYTHDSTVEDPEGVRIVSISADPGGPLAVGVGVVSFPRLRCTK